MIGTLTTRALAWPSFERTSDGVYVWRRVAISAQTQREPEIGNVIARLHFPRPDDPAHRTGFLSMAYLARRLLSYEYGKRLGGSAGDARHPAMTRRHIANVLRDPYDTMATGLHWFSRHTCAHRKYPLVTVQPKTSRMRSACPACESTGATPGKTWRPVRSALNVLADELHASNVARLHYARR